LEAPRSGGGGGGGGGGYKESGLHSLYLLGNSVLCIKGSGDRAPTAGSVASTAAAAGAGAGAGGSSAAPASTTSADRQAAGHPQPQPAVVSLTLLDERNPQQVTVGTTQGVGSNTLLPLGAGQGAGASGSGGGSAGIALSPEVGGNCSAGGGTLGREAAFSATELAAIRAIALSDLAFPLLVNSLCPTIFGQELVKAGLLLGLFGGTPYRERSAAARTSAGSGSSGSSGSSSSGGGGVGTTAGISSEGSGGGGGGGDSQKDFKVRAEIHVLVVGDPGLGKVSFVVFG
jgi:hypothetical protein